MKSIKHKPTPISPSSVASNGKATKPGGVTGKGFMPGKSGNPLGRSPKVADFAKEVREFLLEWHPKSKDKTWLLVLMEALAESDPKILFYYAFGKPIETQVVVEEQQKQNETEKLDFKKLSVEELLQLQGLMNKAR
jgi:hypothetical protein